MKSIRNEILPIDYRVSNGVNAIGGYTIFDSMIAKTLSGLENMEEWEEWRYAPFNLVDALENVGLVYLRAFEK